jgi:hypothetical protein
MNNRIKTISSAALLFLLGVAATQEASAGFVPATRGTEVPIQTCVAEMGKHLDYGDASRVVHWIADMDQRNLVELVIKIQTSVYLKSDDGATRAYTASCVTGTMGDLVDFRLDVKEEVRRS